MARETDLCPRIATRAFKQQHRALAKLVVKDFHVRAKIVTRILLHRIGRSG